MHGAAKSPLPRWKFPWEDGATESCQGRAATRDDCAVTITRRQLILPLNTLICSHLQSSEGTSPASINHTVAEWLENRQLVILNASRMHCEIKKKKQPLHACSANVHMTWICSRLQGKTPSRRVCVRTCVAARVTRLQNIACVTTSSIQFGMFLSVWHTLTPLPCYRQECKLQWLFHTDKQSRTHRLLWMEKKAFHAIHKSWMYTLHVQNGWRNRQRAIVQHTAMIWNDMHQLVINCWLHSCFSNLLICCTWNIYRAGALQMHFSRNCVPATGANPNTERKRLFLQLVQLIWGSQ